MKFNHFKLFGHLALVMIIAIGTQIGNVSYAAEIGVTLVYPATDTNVSVVGLDPVIRFDRDIDGSTLNYTNVNVSSGTDSGLITNIVEITPKREYKLKLYKSLLKLNTTYTITLNNLKDANGQALDQKTFSFTTGSYPDYGVNHFSNPDMEDSSEYANTVGATADYTTDAVHGGSKALKIAQTVTNGKVLFPIYPQAGHTYNYSVWLRLAPNTVGSTTIKLAIKSSGTNSQLFTTALMDANNEYTQLNGTFAVPANDACDSPQFSIYAYKSGSNYFTFYVDDIEFKDVELPGIKSVMPPDGALEADINTDYKVVFSTDMNNPPAITSNNITVNGGTDLIDSIIADTPKSWTIKFKTPLTSGMTYTVSFSGLTDALGRPVPDKTYSFMVKRNVNSSNIAENGSFENTSVNASNYGVNAAASYSNTYANEGVNSLKVVKNTVVGYAYLPLTPNARTTYELTAWIRLDADVQDEKTFSAYYSYTTDKAATTILIGRANNVTGNSGWTKISGLFYSDDITGATSKGISITVDDDSAGTIYYIDNITVKGVVAPSILSSTPVNKEIGVPIDTNMTITFDFDMDTSTFNTRNIYEENDDSIVTGVSVVNNRTCAVTLNRLSEGTVYNIVVENIADITGSKMARRIISFSTIENTSPNLVNNPGFEDAGTWSGYKVIAERSSAYKHSGNYSLKVTTTADYGSLNIAPINQSLRRYSYSFWARLDPNTPMPGQLIRLMINYKVNGTAVGNKIIASTSNFAANDDFKQLKGIYTLVAADGTALKPTDVITEVTFILMPDSPQSAGGIVYIDDLDFREVSSPTLNMPNEDITDAPVDYDVTLQFSNPMDTSTLIKGNIKVNGDTALINKVEIFPGIYKKCKVWLNKPLQYNTEYVVSLDNLKDTFGQILPSTSFKIKTVPKYRVSSRKLYLGSQELTSITQGNLTIVADGLCNFTKQNGSITIVAILYKDEKVQKAVSKMIPVPKMTQEPNDLKITVPVAITDDLSSGNYKLRVFAIDNYVNLQTIEEVLTYAE